MTYDLHCHSHCSDGRLSPREVVLRARDAGVSCLALTDHDSVAGINEAQIAAGDELQLIPGVEISCLWGGKEIHVIGLQLRHDDENLLAALAGQAQRRWDRAVAISQKLEKDSVSGMLDEIRERFPDAVPGRGHFAALLVARGKVRDYQRAFARYLGRKGSAYVAAQWPAMPEAVAWIRASGGLPIVAHPGRYELSGNKLLELLSVFKEAGGLGLELAYPQLFPKEAQRMAQLARKLGLMASQGSDFHSPEQRWTGLGRMPPLPAEVTPIWHSEYWC